MRLTLRTLLAYRDGVLNPSVTHDLHHRISQTEVASNLLRRIETLVQNKRIPALKLNATGLGGDANTVAEYLDDTLASDQVTEFERICIAESEPALAELAECHQLLASALNSTVHVSPEAKAIAIGLTNPDNLAALAARFKPATNKSPATSPNATTTQPVSAEAVPAQPVVAQPVVAQPFTAQSGTIHRVDAAHATELVTATEVIQPVVQVPDVERPKSVEASGTAARSLESPKPASTAKPTPHVPEYLVERSRGGWLFPIAILGTAAILGLLVTQALGPWENIKQLFVASSDDSSDSEKQTEKQIESDNNSGIAKKADSSTTAQTVAPPTPPSNNSTDQVTADTTDAEPILPESPAPSTTTESASNGNSPEVLSDSASSQPLVPNPASADIAKQPVAPIDNDKPAITETNANSPVAESTASSTAPNSKAVTWLTKSAAEGEAILLVRSPSSEGVSTISRLQPSASLPVGADLIVPPSMRPTLNLYADFEWTICGPTLAKSAATSDQTPVSINSPLTRGMFKSLAPGSKLTIQSPAGSSELEFQEGAMAAVEVAYRRISIGPINDTASCKPILLVVSVEGEIVAKQIGATEQRKPAKLQVGEGIAIADGQMIEFELGTIPSWYRNSIDRPVDRMAASDMNKVLNNDVIAQLAELCADHRPETASLAIQTSLMLGDWSGFAHHFLDSESLRAHWSKTIALAEQLLAAEKSNASVLKKELDAAHPTRSDKLFQLLVGDSSISEPKTVLTKLAESLGSDQLDERVLADYQLRNLTGQDFGFQPHLPSKSISQQWRREAASGKLSMRTLEHPIWEAKRNEPEE